MCLGSLLLEGSWFGSTLLLCEWMPCGLVGLQSERPGFISITYSVHSLALSDSWRLHVTICKMGIKQPPLQDFHED